MRCLAGWLLVLVLPFNGITALYLDWRGTAHFHKPAASAPHEHAHVREARHGHYAHVHEHSMAERHQHPPGDPSVVQLDSRVGGHAVAIPSGWSSNMLAAMVTAESAIWLPRAASIRHAGPESAAVAFFLVPLERPPRTSRA